MTYPAIPDGRAPQIPTWQSEFARVRNQLAELTHRGQAATKHYFYAVQTVTQTMANGAELAITFDHVLLDTTGVQAASDRFVCTVAGPYEVSGVSAYPAVANGYRLANVFVNGVVIPGSVGVTPVSSTAQFATANTPVVPVILAVGDYVQIKTQQTSGGPVNLLTNTDTTSSFTVIAM